MINLEQDLEKPFQFMKEKITMTSKIPVICTVVIPCFNYGKYVIGAIESILNQTISNLRVIVVDGGSNDEETLSKLKNYKHDRVDVYFREGRHLVGSNRNFGIEKADSKYICCLDADDTLEPTYIEKAIFIMESFGYDFVSTSLKFVGEKEGVRTIAMYPDLKLMVESNNIHTCAVFKKVMWENLNGYFDVGIGKDHVAEDWDFWLRAMASGYRARNISKEELLNYRVHSVASLSRSKDNPSYPEQLKSILNRSAELFSEKAFTQSKERNKEKQYFPDGDTTLLKGIECHQADQESILIVVPWLLIGGAERLIIEMTKELIRCHKKVILITTKNQKNRIEGSSEDKVKSLIKELYMLTHFLEPNEFYDFIRYLMINRNLSHLILCGSPEFYKMLPDLKKVNPKTIFIDFLFNIVGHTVNHKKYMKYFDCVFAENSTVVDWCQSIGWSKEQIFKLTSGIDLNQFSSKNLSNTVRAKYCNSKNDILVGFSGRLSPEKAPENFLKIASLFKEYPNVKFIMTGGGLLFEQIQKIAQEMENGDNFFFCGVVEDIREYLKAYDILILPSTVDGRPFVVMESMACETAILASKVGGLPDMVLDGENGYLYNPDNIEGFKEGILELVSDVNKLMRFKKKSRLLAEEFFDGSRAYSDLNNILNKTVSNKEG
jgi:glycosyltransferase involved in cell wall biosynthesis